MTLLRMAQNERQNLAAKCGDRAKRAAVIYYIILKSQCDSTPYRSSRAARVCVGRIDFSKLIRKLGIKACSVRVTPQGELHLANGDFSNGFADQSPQPFA
jgi:hypothetical protein